MSSFSRDLRYGARVLNNSRGFTAVALMTLAIAIGANAAIFTFVDPILLKPLPYQDAHRIGCLHARRQEVVKSLIQFTRATSRSER